MRSDRFDLDRIGDQLEGGFSSVSTLGVVVPPDIHEGCEVAVDHGRSARGHTGRQFDEHAAL